MTSRILHRVLVNPTSGNGKAKRLVSTLPGLFARLGLTAEFYVSRTAHHFRELAVSHRLKASDRVVICGGDGSLNMALGAVASGPKPSLALVPCGRGNDVARSLGIPREPEAAIGLLAHGTERRIDVGYVNRMPFASIAAMGLDALVTLAASRMRRVRGRIVYVLAALKELARFVPPHFTIRSDTFSFDGRAMMVSVANCAYYGGGMMLSPSSRPDDGWVEICVVLPVPKLTLLRLLPKVFTGAHVSSPFFLSAPARRVSVASSPMVPVCADGEYLGSTPARVWIEEGAATVVMPYPCTVDDTR